MIEQPPGPRTAAAQLDDSKSRTRRWREHRTEHPERVTKSELAIGRLLYPESVQRPRTRAECDEVPRPCPYVGCRYHLGLDVLVSGSIQYTHPTLDPDEVPWSCSLDLAEHDGLTLDQVAQAIGVTRERARQIEVRALAKVERAAKRMGVDLAALRFGHPEGWPSP